MTPTPVPTANKDGIVLLSKGLVNDATGHSPLWLVQTAENAVLVSSAELREEYISKMGCGDGYSVQKITTLEDLQKSLHLHKNGYAKQTDDNTSAKNNYYPSGLDEVKRFELFREMIEHEDDLLNQRVSWIILAQSFLMAAFISAASSIENRSFLYITAGVGLATVIVTMPALLAAGQNIEVQQRVYFLGLESDAQCQKLHGHDRDALHKSSDEIVQRRIKGHIFPNTAFRGRFGIPILKTVMALAVVQVAGWCGLLIALIMNDW